MGLVEKKWEGEGYSERVQNSDVERSLLIQVTWRGVSAKEALWRAEQIRRQVERRGQVVDAKIMEEW